jgi:DNA-binding phage protein
MASIKGDEIWLKPVKDNTESSKAMMDEVYRLINDGEVDSAKATLRKLINMTCGFKAISEEVGRHPKSIMRMLTPEVDPGVRAFMAVVNATARQSIKLTKEA